MVLEALGGGGGGAGGGAVMVLHSGTLSNSGTVSAAAGSGGFGKTYSWQVVMVLAGTGAGGTQL